tara:strand:- start:2087 stop:2347 length:261 start_codon:yes stop_codon:yes gene_type:complete
MKLNEFQNKLVHSDLGVGALEMTSSTLPPSHGTENFRKLIDSVASDLSAAALACEKAGVTLQYVAELALAIADGTNQPEEGEQLAN